MSPNIDGITGRLKLVLGDGEGNEGCARKHKVIVEQLG